MEDLQRDTTAQIRAAVENFFERNKIKHEPFDERNVANAISGVAVYPKCSIARGQAIW